MKKMDEQKHFLALLDRPGDFALIDISKLDIALGYQPNTLAELDTFTMYYSKKEIVDAIKRANIVDDRYINGKLVIQDNQKHNPIMVIDREFYDNFRIDLFLKEKLTSKNDANKLVNKLMAITKDSEVISAFKKAVNSCNLDLICDILFNLPYLEQRKYVIYLIEWRNKDREIEKQKELIRDKAA